MLIRVVNHEVHVKEQHDEPGEGSIVTKIDTLSSSYIVNAMAIGEAIRSGIPYLEVDGYKAGHSNTHNIPLLVLTGHVWGHQQREDGTGLETACVTNFHLEDGKIVSTPLGLLKQSADPRSLAHMLIDRAHGRG